jgi:4Fe-4S ferredoxin
LPVKLYKNDDGKVLSIGQILYAKHFRLSVSRDLCKGCDVCKTVCPREAITLKPLPRRVDGQAVAPLVDINAGKCDFHGICGAMCPFGAITVSINSERRAPVVEKECYPELVRRITVNSDRCEPGCRVCEEKCPLKVISVVFKPINEEEAAAKGIRFRKGEQPMQTIVNIDVDHCACCKVCEAACPAHVMIVEKFFTGRIRIDQKKCPPGCRDCLDVCPVNALYLEDGKVYPNDEFCIYCKACLNVCPNPEALHVQRTSVRHTPVSSGAWNRSLERLTSIDGFLRELTAKRLLKAREAVRKLPE